MSGVLGDGALHAGKYNMAMVRRAIRNDYPIPPELRAALIAQMAKIVEQSEDERNRIAASKVILAGDGINVKMTQMDQADDMKEQPELHLHAHASLDEIRDAALGRLRAARSLPTIPDSGTPTDQHGHPSGLGGNGCGKLLDSGTASPPDLNGSNGSHYGNGSAGPDR